MRSAPAPLAIFARTTPLLGDCLNNSIAVSIAGSIASAIPSADCWPDCRPACHLVPGRSLTVGQRISASRTTNLSAVAGRDTERRRDAADYASAGVPLTDVVAVAAVNIRVSE